MATTGHEELNPLKNCVSSTVGKYYSDFSHPLNMKMSDNNECDMSCAPANPWRLPVPGLEGVKWTTEDATRVDTQAPVTVNATGQSKKYVQQAFHPGLFNRPRSASTGSVQLSTNKAKDPQDHQPENNIRSVELPDWQRVPVSRNPNKKRKFSNPQSPENVHVSNRFDGLPVNADTQEADKPTEKKPNKPPPIILYGIEDVKKLTEFLVTVAARETFKYKIVNKNQMRILSEDTDVYKKLISAIREKGLIGHTFNRKEERNYRLVVKNLHHTTPHQDIKDAFEETGNVVLGEIINARFGPDEKPTSTFFVNLQSGPNNKSAKEIRYIYHQAVIVEDPKKEHHCPMSKVSTVWSHQKLLHEAGPLS